MFEKFETIDWLDSAENENKARLVRAAKARLSWIRLVDATQSWLILATAGAIIGFIAVLLSITTAFLADLRLGFCWGPFYLNADFCCLGSADDVQCTQWRDWPAQYPVYIVFSVLLAFVACLIVIQIGPMAAGSGISEIKCIVSGFDMDGFLDLRTLIAKVIALPLTIASGFSVGKEGPSVHYAACVGSIVGHSLSAKVRKFPAKRRELVVSCCAAGVAVAFGSPIGGVLFAIEEMTAQANVELGMIWRSYFCCLVATGILSLMDPFRTGQMVVFSVQYDTLWSYFELPFFMIIGVFGGLMGQFIIRSNLRIQKLRKKYWASYPLQEVTLIALVTAGVCYFNPYLRIDMTKSMQILFHECDHGFENDDSCDPDQRGWLLATLAVAFLIRSLLLLVSYGAKIPSGIFVPSLAIGALFGRFVGTCVWMLADRFDWCPENVDSCVNPGSYAFLGAGALLAGVMHITVTVCIVMFELTGALNYIVPSMIVVGITRLISSNVGEGGIADMAIKANKFPFLSSEEHSPYAGKTVKDIMVAPVVSIPEHSVSNIDMPTKYKSYPVVDVDNNLVGSISDGSPTVNRSPLTVTASTPLLSARDTFINLGPRVLYVVEKGKLTGVLSRKDIAAVEIPADKPENSSEIFLAEKFAQFLSMFARTR